MEKQTSQKQRDELYKAFLISIKNKKLFEDFLEDILTPQEMEDIYQRWEIIQMLNKNIPQRKIADALGIGVATVTRGSRELRNKKGGFRKVLDLLEK